MSSRRPVALTPPDRILADIGRTTTITLFLTELSGVSRDVIVRALGNLSGPLPARQLRLEAGTTVEVDIDVAIPHGMPPGQHNFLFEVVDRNTGSVIDSLETSVDVQHTKAVRMHVSPASIRRRRRGRIRIIVRNHDEETQHIRLRAETDDPETEVRLEMPDVSVRPGELVRVSGRVKAKAFYIGKQKERWYSIIGDGAGTPIYTRGNVRQLPMIGKNIKGVMVLLTILMVWAGSTIAIIRAISPATSEVTAGATEGPTDPSAGGDQDGAGAAGAEPVLIDVTGTVTAVPDGSGVVVTWRTVSLGDAATEGKVTSGSSAESPDIALQQTETDETGAFVVPGIDSLGLYEFSFFKAGHQTKTIIVQPNGQPVTLEVSLEAGSGAIGGITVDAAGNPLGGVDVTLTDGAITYSLSTPTSGDSAGRFSFDNLSSPATYVLDARIAGRGLASTTIELATGQSIGDVRLVLSPDVATLAGKITAAAFEAGSTAGADFRLAQDSVSDFGPTFTITATDGSLTRSTTTLTEGLLAGTFRLEQLPVGRTYTITYEAPGFQALTEQIELTLSTPEREISMVRSTGRLRGKVTVTGSSLSPTAVAVTVTNPENTYKTTDAISSDGSLLVDGIVPGAYVVVFEALGLEKQVREVDIGAGTSAELNVNLSESTTSAAKSSLSFKVVKGGGDSDTPVTAALRFRADGDCGSVGTDTDCVYDVDLVDGNLTISGLEAGGYVIDFLAPGFAPRRLAAQVAVSTDAPQVEVLMIPLGSLQGLVTDDTSAPLQGLQLGLYLESTLIATATTSESGEFLFSRQLLPQTYTIKVTGAGFLPVERSLVGALAATLNLDITVRGKALITGEVRSLDLLTGNFQAVEGSKFTIYFRQDQEPSNGEWIDAATLGLAKSLGGYRLAVEPNEDTSVDPDVVGPFIDVCVVATIETASETELTPEACDSPRTGLTSRKSTGISIQLDETVTRSFYFSPTPGTVSGKVTVGGIAEENVKVEARRIDSDGRVLESSSTLTAADGSFSFTALTPVRPTPDSGEFLDETSCTFSEGTCWFIRASQEGTGFRDSPLLTVYPGRSITLPEDIDIVKDGGTYNVTFTDDRGNSLIGVTTLLFPKDLESEISWDGTCPGPTDTQCQVASGATSSFRFIVPDPGEYVIEAQLDGYRRFSTSVTIGQNAVIDQIHRLSATKGGLVIDVRNVTGESVVGASVTVSGSSPVLGCVTGSEGKCQIDGIDEGVKTLIVSAPGLANSTVVATVIGGQILATSAVVGASAGSLYMSAVDTSGASVLGVTFTVTVGANTYSCVDGADSELADGACLLDGLSAGVRASVTASATDHRSTTGSIGVGSGSSAITLVLTPARSATFTVTADGSTVIGATVTATDRTGRTASCSTASGTGASDGTCTIEDLALGPVSLVVSGTGYQTRTVVVSMTTESSSFTVDLVSSTTTLRGRITSNGSPVNGATVVIDRGSTSISTTSDSNGDYVFADLLPGSGNVTVTATGYANATRTGVQLTAGLITTQDFVLAPTTGRLRLTIQTSGGAPVEDVEVTISELPALSATSDATGLVTFDDLAPGTYTINLADTIDPPRYASQSLVVNVDNGATTNLPIDLVSSTTTLRGRITSNGSPVNGATVQITNGTRTSSTTSNLSGDYEFTNLTPGSWDVTVTATGYASATRTGVQLTAGLITTQDFVLAPTTGRLRLTIQTSGGTPVEDVEVTISELPALSATSNASGLVTFDDLAPGTYTINLADTIDPPRYASQSVVVNIEAGTTTNLPIDLVSSTTTLRGRITSNGSPVNGATVQITNGTRTSSTTSNLSGDYEFTNLTPGSWDVTVGATGYETTDPTTVTLTTNTITTQDFVLTPNNGRLRLTVQTSGGTPVEDIQVTISELPALSATSNASGLVTFDDLAPGTYTINLADTIDPPRYASQSVVVNIEAGTTTNLPIDLVSSTTTLRGRITSNGSPVNGATVQITNGTTTSSTTSNSTGDYEFTNLSTGSWNVTVTATGYASATRTGVQLTAGLITTQDFVLAPATGRIEFIIKTSGGSPIQGISVTVSGTPPKNDDSDVDGLVTFEDLAPGVYTIDVADTVVPPRYASQSFVVNVERGFTTRLPVHLGTTRSVVVVGVAGIPAIGFGPQTPLAVTVGLVPSGGGSAITSVAVNGFDRSIATFVEVPDGTYSVTIDGVSSGTILVDGATYDVSPRSITVSGPTTVDAGLALLPVSRVDVKVPTDEDGATAELSNGYLLSPVSGTSAGGSAILNSIPPGSYTLTVSKSGFTTYSATVTVTDYSASSDGMVTLASVTLSASNAPGTLTATVTDNATPANNLAGATVLVVETGQSCTTSAAGTCTIVTPPGSYTVRASHSGHSSATTTSGSITVSPGLTTSTSISLAPSTATVKFTVTDGTNPLASAQIRDVLTGTTHSTDSTGTYSWTGLAATDTFFEISKTGHATVHLAVRPVAGEIRSLGVRLTALPTPTNTLSVLVIDARNGSPLQGVAVTKSDDSALCASTTSAAGTCEPAAALPTGSLTLKAVKTGYVTTRTTVAITSEASTHVVIAMHPSTAVLDVRVREAQSGTPLSGVTVAYTGASGTHCNGTHSSTNAEGICEITGLSSGTLTLTLSKTDYTSVTAVVTLEPGQRHSIDVLLSPRGSLVITLASAATAETTFLIVGTSLGCSIANAGTTCTIEHIPTGTWILRASRHYADRTVGIAKGTNTVTIS